MRPTALKACLSCQLDRAAGDAGRWLAHRRTPFNTSRIVRKMSTTVVQDIPRRPRAKAVLVVTACAFFAFVSISCGSPHPSTERHTAPIADDSPLGRAFTSGASNVEVEGEGRVARVLPDDLNGRRHQRFVVRLASGQTLLVAHNIDIAPRIGGLKEGDSVRFKGEYVWNEEGGVIHWTHHDPEGRHVAGWVKHNGKTFK